MSVDYPEKLRVLQVMAGARQGGAETYFVNMVTALARAGVRQQAVIRGHSAREEALEAAGVPVTTARFGGMLDLVTRFRLQQALRVFRPHVVVSWMTRATAAVPARGAYAHIARLGGYYPLEHYRACDWLICNTRDLVRHCIDGGYESWHIDYIPNFVPWQERPAEARASHATPDTAPLLLALGRLHSNKAFDVAIRALAQLPGTFLWIAGEGSEKAALEKLAADCQVADRVRWLGWRADREALVAAADIVIVPSRAEPFGNVILDAWAGGKPLVAAASEGPRLFVRDGENGLLVTPEDWLGLSAAIKRLLDDKSLGARIAAGGRDAYLRDHTEAVAVTRWKSLLARAASERFGT